MELIKNFVITLVTTLIFITAVELIGPDNSMKKYLKFVLGLILLAVILNPILSFFKDGESVITNAIDKYEKEVSGFVEEKDEVEVDNKAIREESFKENFNKNCVSLLKKEYKNMDFECNVQCDIDFENMKDFSINKLEIGIKDKSIKKVQRVDLSKEANMDEEDEKQKEIKTFLSDELQLDKDKIEVYYV